MTDYNIKKDIRPSHFSRNTYVIYFLICHAGGYLWGLRITYQLVIPTSFSTFLRKMLVWPLSMFH